MVVTCIIEFDNNPFGTYYAGQVITGRVTLNADKPKQVKGIALKIRGFADTRWEESTSRRTTDSKGRSSTKRDTIHYRGHEEYIKSKTFLLGSDENQSSLIEPGIHTYTFACHLPNTCPSSFEGIYGHIRYLVKVELIRPWKYNQTFTKGFTVLKVMDLNYDSPLLRVPSQSEAQKVFCCGPCKTQPLDIHVSLPQGGYVPGQTIPVGVLISNETNIRIEEAKVELVMLICYYSQTPRTATKNERIVVAKIKGEGVPVHCKKQFDYALIVPATPPTCFNLCRLLQIAYQVQVEIKVKGWHANQVICVPVTVGNVPLMSVIQKQPTATDSFATGSAGYMQRALMNGGTADEGEEVAVASADDVEEKTVAATGLKTNELEAVVQTSSGVTTNSSIMPLTPPSPWMTDDSIPPPSYEMAAHMKSAKINADEAHDYGEAEFAPRYPVFKLCSASELGADEVDIVGTTNGSASAANVTADKSTWL
ncbi:arrestin domain-containing protein 17-like [Anastrepha obliqua]|uniref:arrestin domain-containing protein 17-like n=1 Tax=Anastrepha obliqua TaxID=95512 RepID=UPI00240A2E97|nr:arrestin domain-containing protein 17-like [Anastrepha obliqua]